jgi:hypothetical protein
LYCPTGVATRIVNASFENQRIIPKTTGIIHGRNDE